MERIVGRHFEETMMWLNLDKTRPDSAHYSVMRKQPGIDGMAALREMFPDAKANELNFVLFSTSGVHGTYNTIEEAEQFLKGKYDEGCNKVTFLIVHPRLVALRYGVCDPATQDDIDYLKRLRASSHEVAARIGAFVPPNARHNRPSDSEVRVDGVVSAHLED